MNQGIVPTLLELEYSEEELRGVEKSNVTENAFLVNWSCIRHEFGSICLPSRKSTGHGGFGEKARTCDLNMIVSYGSFETQSHSSQTMKCCLLRK